MNFHSQEAFSAAQVKRHCGKGLVLLYGPIRILLLSGPLCHFVAYCVFPEPKDCRHAAGLHSTAEGGGSVTKLLYRRLL